MFKMNKNKDKKKNDKDQPEATDATQEDAKAADAVEEAVEEVVDPIESLKKENAQLNDKLLRLGAEFQNALKRSDRQVAQAKHFATEGLIKSLLPMIDNFELTLQSATNENCDVANLSQGVQMIFESLNSTLSAQGFKPITVKAGDRFDPNLHEALLRQPSEEYDENCIIAELGKGYAVGEKTIRPVKVSVASKPVEPVDSEENEATAETKE